MAGKSQDKIKSIGELLKDDANILLDDDDDDNIFLLDQQSKPYLSRMESFAANKKERNPNNNIFETNYNDLLDATAGSEGADGESQTLSTSVGSAHSPKLHYLDTKKKSSHVFVGMGYGSVIGFDDEEETGSPTKGGLFDDADDQEDSLFGGSRTRGGGQKKAYSRDYSDDLFGDSTKRASSRDRIISVDLGEDDPTTTSPDKGSGGIKDLDAGLDKLLEGWKANSSKGGKYFGAGILSEEELIRSNVAAHRTKDEIAAILAAVPPEVSHHSLCLSSSFVVDFSGFLLIYRQ